MRIVDFIVISYFALFRKAKKNQLLASVFCATAFPLTFLLVFLIVYITRLVFPLNSFFEPIYIGVLIFVVGFLTNNLLVSYYLPQENRLIKIVDKFEKVRMLFLIPIIIYMIIRYYT